MNGEIKITVFIFIAIFPGVLAKPERFDANEE